MAAYRRVYDSRHLRLTAKNLVQLRNPVSSIIEYGLALPLPLFMTAYADLRRTRNSAIAEGPRDASCQLKSCQLPRNSVETICTTSSDHIDVMKLEV